MILSKTYVKFNIINAEEYFLCHIEGLIKAEMLQLKTCYADFMSLNQTLEILWVPKLQNIGKFFLFSNKNIKFLDLPKLINLEKYALQFNLKLIEIRVPNRVNLDALSRHLHRTVIKYPPEQSQ